MDRIQTIAAEIATRAAQKDGQFVVAIAGPPASGKSTLAQDLSACLDDAVVLPMDGFHLDNAILEARGLMHRKGAPETFDADGFVALINRMISGQAVIAPGFDRSLDLARAGAIAIPANRGIVLVEGNYLHLDEAPWRNLRPLWDFSIFLKVDKAVLEERLMKRWLDHGKSHAEALEKVKGNDLPNAVQVLDGSLPADMVI